MNDKIIRAYGQGQEFIVSACCSKNLVETARNIHKDGKIAIKQLGELLTASALIGDLMKGEKDLLTLEIEGDGDLKKVVVTADSHGHVKGFVDNPNAIEGIGQGSLVVIKDQGLKTPYNSMTAFNGSVAATLNAYYNQSVQLPTFFCLGAEANEYSVSYSFGYMVQAMPFVSETSIRKLLSNLEKNQDVDAIIRQRATPEILVDRLLEGFDIKERIEKPIEFKCSCSREKGLDDIARLGQEEIGSIVKEGNPIDVTCGFCGKRYTYSIDEIAKLLNH